MSKVVKDRVTRKSLGFGFVKFLKVSDALDAIELKNGFMVGDKRIKVSVARPSTDDIRNCKLYVTNLPKNFKEEDVIKLFSQYGDIIECRGKLLLVFCVCFQQSNIPLSLPRAVLQDRNTKSNRGVAFVQFGTRNEATDG